MPRRPARPCSKPGCPHRQPCPVHGGQRPPRERRPDSRPSASERGYDRKWRRIRAQYLRLHPRCVVCGEPATEVDHIVPLADGGTNKHGNLQALCKSHHSQKTNRFDGGFGNRRGGGI